MAVSKLKTLKDYFVAALQAINGTGGYVNTVAMIDERTVNKVADITKGAAELFVEIKSTKDGADVFGGKFPETATFEITGQIMNPLDASNNDAAIFSLRKDMRKALIVDRTCGGAAIKSKITGSSFVYGSGPVQCVVSVEVIYLEDES